MTDKDIDTTTAPPKDVPPVSNEEAAKIVEHDPALQKAGEGNDPDLEDN